ncbi:CRISPR-associated endoribonuclease Cas6 [Thermodesulfovibrio yellowstonii]|uniref:CRISPR-associated endoribonuclease Cas6 n=1 Tax=Thermodesulfovibrio yellowstonii TaxID=28262 RepID=UPI000421A26F|nr:CRISPR-associated endoribonuclease Cas6 [Thermodesulfovibrio islandicus]
MKIELLFKGNRKKRELDAVKRGMRMKALASWIYSILQKSNKDYAQEMHDRGVPVPESKKFIKPFVFSYLYPKSDNTVAFKVASCDATFIHHFLSGLSKGMNEIVFDREVLEPEKFRILPPVDVKYNEDNDYFYVDVFSLSPVTVKCSAGAKNQYFYLPDAMNNEEVKKQIEQALQRNLADKYLAVYKELPSRNRFWIKFYDLNRIPVMFISESGKTNKVLSFLGRMRLYGDFDMIYTAMQMGFGSKTGLGFGFIENHQNYSR